MTADLTKPLSEVPVGAHVVHEGEVYRYDGECDQPPQPWLTHILARTPIGMGFRHVRGDATVLRLEGTSPRPLRECEGRGVWWVGRVFRWVRNRMVGRWEDSDGDLVHSKDTLVWPIIGPDPPPEPAAEPAGCTGHCGRMVDEDGDQIHNEGCPAAEPAARWEARQDDAPFNSTSSIRDTRDGEELCGNLFDWQARALADHLNTSGPDGGPWVPAPARPTWDEVIWNWVHRPTATPDNLTADLAKHGWRVVDVQGLASAIGWLRAYRRDPAYRSALDISSVVALLDALGVVRDA